MLPLNVAFLSRARRLAIQRSIATIKRPSWLTIAWLIVLAHTAAIVHEALESQFSSTYRDAVTYLLLLATIGTLRSWGPPVLFALGGFSITYYWHLFDGPSSSPVEAVMLRIGQPAICGALGALIGYGAELWRSCAKGLRRNEGWPPINSPGEQGAGNQELRNGARGEG
jgi:hypothetical protein